jgi:hypothetical protein
MKKTIQVFLKEDKSAEIAGVLNGLKVHQGFVWLDTSDESNTFKVQHVIPISEIRMMRIYDEDEGD